jgi:molybdenum cofactor biosynthesis enzyme MoaA
VEKSKNKNSFCIRPFNSLTLRTDGELRVCCEIMPTLTEYQNFRKSNIKDYSIKDWWSNDYNNYLRASFLKNEKPRECVTCWKRESQGLSSLRLESNYQYRAIFQNKVEKNLKLIGKHDLSYPEDVEIHITNLCNLKCQMCSGASSSKLLVENNALGFEKRNQKDYDLNEDDYQKIVKLSNHDLTLLNLRGGEPLINKTTIDLLSNLVRNKKAHNISLQVTTNGTKCNDEILNLLQQFKNVRLMLSIEGIEKHNEYMRYPSMWDVIKKNIEKFKTLTNTYMYINAVIQNLNILYIDKLIEYAYENEIYLHFSKLEDPDYLDMFNLPEKTLRTAYNKLSQIPDKKLVHTKNIKEIVLLVKDRIGHHTLDSKKYNEFLDMIKMRDQYRKIHIKDYMPELAKDLY